MLQRDEVERFHGFAIVVLFISVGGDGARAISKGAKWLESRFREHHLIDQFEKTLGDSEPESLLLRLDLGHFKLALPRSL